MWSFWYGWSDFFLRAGERSDASDGCFAQCWKGDTLQMFPGRCAQGEDTLPAKGNNEYCIPDHPTNWLSFLSLKHPEKCGCEEGGGSVSYNRIMLEREGWQVDKNFFDNGIWVGGGGTIYHLAWQHADENALPKLQLIQTVWFHLESNDNEKTKVVMCNIHFLFQTAVINILSSQIRLCLVGIFSDSRTMCKWPWMSMNRLWRNFS